MQSNWVIAAVALCAVAGFLYFQHAESPAEQLNDSLLDAREAGLDLVERLNQ